MKWVKKKFIFRASGQYDWMHSHTTPVAAVVLQNKVRIFMSTRSKQDAAGNFISYSSFIDVSKNDPANILYVHHKPILDLGSPGTFDEFGIMVAKPVVFENKIYLYYMGWQRLSGYLIQQDSLLSLEESAPATMAREQDNSLTRGSKRPRVFSVREVEAICSS